MVVMDVTNVMDVMDVTHVTYNVKAMDKRDVWDRILSF